MSFEEGMMIMIYEIYLRMDGLHEVDWKGLYTHIE
jgi:hypothetical protein